MITNSSVLAVCAAIKTEDGRVKEDGFSGTCSATDKNVRQAVIAEIKSRLLAGRVDADMHRQFVHITESRLVQQGFERHHLAVRPRQVESIRNSSQARSR